MEYVGKSTNTVEQELQKDAEKNARKAKGALLKAIRCYRNLSIAKVSKLLWYTEQNISG